MNVPQTCVFQCNLLLLRYNFHVVTRRHLDSHTDLSINIGEIYNGKIIFHRETMLLQCEILYIVSISFTPYRYLLYLPPVYLMYYIGFHCSFVVDQSNNGSRVMTPIWADHLYAFIEGHRINYFNYIINEMHIKLHR